MTPDGRFAYTGNAATGSISGFSIAADGTLTRVTEDGRTASTPRPNDLAIAGGYLYAINPIVGSVTAYRINADGSLSPLPPPPASPPAWPAWPPRRPERARRRLPSDV